MKSALSKGTKLSQEHHDALVNGNYCDEEGQNKRPRASSGMQRLRFCQSHDGMHCIRHQLILACLVDTTAAGMHNRHANMHEAYASGFSPNRFDTRSSEQYLNEGAGCS